MVCLHRNIEAFYRLCNFAFIFMSRKSFSNGLSGSSVCHRFLTVNFVEIRS